MPRPVDLHVYDLSNGLARSLSAQLLGKQIDGIWHTGVVLGRTEYFFGQGIQRCDPNHAPFGKPVQVLRLGETELEDDMLEDFLHDIHSRFNASTYDLLSNNCNNFSNEVAEFLVGRGIPEHITGLPAEVAATPFGRMIMPMLQPALQQRLGNATASGFATGAPPAASTIAHAVAATGATPSQQPAAAPTATEPPSTSAGAAAATQSLSALASDPSEAATASARAAFKDALEAEHQKVLSEGISDANKAAAEAMKRVMLAVQQGLVAPPPTCAPSATRVQS